MLPQPFEAPSLRGCEMKAVLLKQLCLTQAEDIQRVAKEPLLINKIPVYAYLSVQWARRPRTSQKQRCHQRSNNSSNSPIWLNGCPTSPPTSLTQFQLQPPLEFLDAVAEMTHFALAYLVKGCISLQQVVKDVKNAPREK